VQLRDYQQQARDLTLAAFGQSHAVLMKLADVGGPEPERGDKK
jgi:hypothetical protein